MKASSTIWLAVLILTIGPTLSADWTNGLWPKWANWLPDMPHNDLKIRLYSSDGKYEARSLGQAKRLFKAAGYNSELNMVLIILGYNKDQNSMIQQTVQALLSRKVNEQYNIMAVELPRRFGFTARNFYYLRPAANVPSAGKALGKFINEAVRAGAISPEKVSVISFSLGVQIAGYMGRTIKGRIHSITGVEPFGLGFDWSRVMTRLIHVSRADAQFVYLHHSNSAMFGTTQRLAHADYLFNDGHTQAGCKKFDLMCSHFRGFTYFLEALRKSPGLPAVQCNSLDHLVHCKCHGHRLSHVGFPPDFGASGMYHLRTRDQPPYSLGKDGVVGNRCKREKTDYIYKMGIHYDKLMHMLERK